MRSLSEAPPESGTVPFVRALADHGDRVALMTDDAELTYRDLAARVDDVARRLGDVRRLVLLEGSNDVDFVVGYLAALAGGHPVLVASGENADGVASLIALYDPDVVAGRASSGVWLLDERRTGTAHQLHPDLALLLSTSGSTGSPKLVRLSHENLQANAESIAEYLDIRPTDRAATTLPLHYCYGLSVLHSHLLRGAGVILTGLSVVDACFWELFRSKGGTTFAGVPYTFELLDRVGFDTMHLPSLRYVTQAGGRLAPEQVERFAALGRTRGWDFFVMYGQTEATARMAYLPPDLASVAPEAIGIPVPGGSFALEPVIGVDDPDVGELVYDGPNVMLGYAQAPSDLRLGRTVDVLRTGDLARRRPDRLYELVGRRSRFVKILGLRIDLQRAEALLERDGVPATCVGFDGELVIAVVGEHDAPAIRQLAARRLGLPPGAVRVCAVHEVPRLPTGKPDYRALSLLVAVDSCAQSAARDTASDPVASDSTALCRLYAEVLDRSDVDSGSTFVGLGGDSLSYVEMSVRLEEALGHLPPSWHTTPIAELAGSERPRRRGAGRVVETSVALRALAIVFIVGTHIGLLSVLGSAHVLVAVAGFNFARFQLTPASRLERLRQQVRSVARVVVPSVAWIAVALFLTDQYRFVNLFLLNGFLGPDSWTSQWHFWFVEVLVYVLVGVVLLLAVPSIDRLERRYPFGFVTALLGIALLMRYEVVDLGLLHTKPVFWLFALGWATARANALWQKAFVTCVAVVTVPGFFGDPWRDALIVGGLALLVWVRSVPSLPGLNRVAGWLAGSSLYVYLTHWLVYPSLRGISPVVALLGSLLAGIAYWKLATWVMSRLPVTRSGQQKPGTESQARPASGASSRVTVASIRP